MNYHFENFKEFTLFLYIYIADSDDFIHETEVEVIKKKIPKLFPNTDAEKVYQEALKKFRAFKKEEVDKIIHSNFKEHQEKSFTSKYKIFTDLYDIIVADGVLDERETRSIQKLKDIIDQNLEQKN